MDSSNILTRTVDGRIFHLGITAKPKYCRDEASAHLRRDSCPDEGPMCAPCGVHVSALWVLAGAHRQRRIVDDAFFADVAAVILRMSPDYGMQEAMRVVRAAFPTVVNYFRPRVYRWCWLSADGLTTLELLRTEDQRRIARRLRDAGAVYDELDEPLVVPVSVMDRRASNPSGDPSRPDWVDPAGYSGRTRGAS